MNLVPNIKTSYNLLSKFQKTVVIISVLLLLISFTLPAFYIDRSEDPGAWSNSFFLFFLGWMSLLGGSTKAFLFWLANPVYIIALLAFLERKKYSIFFAVSSAALAGGFSFVQTLVTSESGSISNITGFGSGYICWVASFTALALGAVLSLFLKNPNQAPLKIKNRLHP